MCGASFTVGGRLRSPATTFCSKNCRYAARYRRPEALCKELTIQQACYIAGIVDGEGSIMLVVRKSVREPSVHLRVSVSNTYHPLLDWLTEVTGIGKSYEVDNQKYNRSTKLGGLWKTQGEAAEGLLKQILPYLIIKRRQAKVGLMFQRRLRNPALKADRLWQMVWLGRMKEMNARGIKPQD